MSRRLSMLLIVALLLVGVPVRAAATDAPMGLRATAGATADTVALEWAPPLAPLKSIQGYYLYRGVAPGEYGSVPLTDFPVVGTRFADRQVNPGRTYYYVVRAVYVDNTESSPSDEVAMPLRGVKTTVIRMTVDEVDAFVDGLKTTLDVGPQIVNGRALVPLRFLGTALGARLAFEAASQTVAMVLGINTVFLRVGSNSATVNGFTQPLDVPAVIVEGRTLVPLRFVSESLGARVEYADETRVITVRYESEADAEPGAVVKVEVSPPEVRIAAGQQQKFTARGFDGQDREVPMQPVWSATAGGVIDVNGNFAGTAPGVVTVTAAVGGVRGTATVTITPVAVNSALTRSDLAAALLQSNVFIDTDQGQGSGFIIGADGLIATADHVIADAGRISVRLADGRWFHDARVVGRAPDADTALLQLGAKGLPTVELGDSAAVRVADRVMAVGNPLGIEGTVTEGIISSTNAETDFTTVPVFLTTAPISPGSSGGALVDEQGKVIGVVFASLRGGQLLNYASPIRHAQSLQSAYLAGGQANVPPGSGSTSGPDSRAPGAGTGGGTAVDAAIARKALLDQYEVLNQQAGDLIGRNAGDATKRDFYREAGARLTPLVDRFIDAAPPGDFAPWHQEIVKYYVGVLTVWELFGGAAEANLAGDDSLGSARLAGGRHLIEQIDRWRRNANRLGLLLADTNLPPNMASARGGATVDGAVARWNAWLDGYNATQAELEQLRAQGGDDVAAARLCDTQMRGLEPLAGDLIAAAPPASYSDWHRAAVRYAGTALLANELCRSRLAPGVVGGTAADLKTAGLELSARVRSLGDAVDNLVRQLWQGAQDYRINVVGPTPAVLPGDGTATAVVTAQVTDANGATPAVAGRFTFRLSTADLAVLPGSGPDGTLAVHTSNGRTAVVIQSMRTTRSGQVTLGITFTPDGADAATASATSRALTVTATP